MYPIREQIGPIENRRKFKKSKIIKNIFDDLLFKDQPQHPFHALPNKLELIKTL